MAIRVPASTSPFGTKSSASSPLLLGRAAQSGRHRNGLAAGKNAVLAEVEAHDLMHALEPDIERATVLCDQLRIVPAALAQRPSVGAEDRRHLGIRNGAGTNPVVNDAAPQPPTLVAHRNEAGAVGRDPDRRKAAEIAVRGSQDKSTAVFEQPELPARGITEVERRDRLSAYLDRNRRLRRRLRGAGDGNQIEHGGNEGDDDRSGEPCVNPPERRATAAHASSLRCCRRLGWKLLVEQLGELARSLRLPVPRHRRW